MIFMHDIEDKQFWTSLIAVDVAQVKSSQCQKIKPEEMNRFKASNCCFLLSQLYIRNCSTIATPDLELPQLANQAS